MPPETTLDAWCKGYEAGWAGVPQDANPCAQRAELARAWDKGWRTSRTATHVALSHGGLPVTPERFQRLVSPSGSR